MKRIPVILIFLFCFTNLYSQTAPNFTITDTDNNSINLYEDLLAQDKIVVIKMFFVVCPICKPYNEPFQALYEELGEGNGDVEFLLLTTKTWDSNESVGNYREEYGLTFPGSGYSGGGYEATDPYRNGTFGTFFGAPTFVVIAPNKKVFFDVNGSGTGINGTINAIRQKVQDIRDGNYENETTTTVNVSLDPLKESISVPSHKIILRSADDHSDNYEVPQNFTYPTEDYPELSNPEIVIEINSIDHVGITTLDLVTIQRSILQITQLDNFYVFASDVNASGSITASDLVSIRKLILGINEVFPNNKSFLSINSDCASSIDNCTESIPIDLNSAINEINFKLLKYGDVR